jgi:hypothetical protein
MCKGLIVCHLAVCSRGKDMDLYNGVRSVKFATPKKLIVKRTMFAHGNIHKFAWTSPDGKPHNQIHHILIDRSRHSCILDVRLFRAADCDTGHYPV